jgi:signal transduction histidine kinase
MRRAMIGVSCGAARARVSDARKGVGRVRVLVVEDETALAQVLRAGLTDEGFAVDVQHTGTDGLWAATENPYTRRCDDVDLDDLAYTERDRLAAHHPDLTVRADLTPVRVTEDPHDLGRALRNLADNAARHARTQVTLRVSVRDGWGCVEVTDDGPGVPDADRERIFDRFVRLDDSRTRPDGGSGLGLAITREVVQVHGGHVQAMPGPGMTIRILLPRDIDSEHR